MEKPEMSFDREWDKEDVVHVQNGTLISPNMKEISPFATTQTDLEDIMLSKISHTERQIPYDFTYFH